LIRTEYIQSAILKNKDIDEIIKINGIIESIPYVEDEMFFGDKRFKRDKNIQQFLHKEITNREAISEMKFFLNKIKDGEILKSLVRRLEKTILKKQLYKKIKPKVHYSFCHNDFHRNNIIAEKGLGRHKVIDWNSYCVALRGWDMNCYFSYFEFDFDEIKEMYIDKIAFDDEIDENIAKIYFVFMQILVWIKKMKGKRCGDKLESHFIPAFDFVEKIANKL